MSGTIADFPHITIARAREIVADLPNHADADVRKAARFVFIKTA